jgi:hypothetical protein
MKLGVCTRSKDDIIIKDWVNYYLKLGFDKIIIYDNMSNPPIKEILPYSDRVEIIIDNVPHSNQPIIYQECLNNNKDLDWLLLCDADEFIYCGENNIKTFLLQFSEDTCTVIINWVVFGTSNLHQYDKNITVFEQFVKREDYTNFWNRFVKSFVRPKLIDNVGNVHITNNNNNYKTKTVYNEIINLDSDITSENIDYRLSDNTPVVMIHYMLLDFESMIKKHYRNKNGSLYEKDCTKYTMEWYHLQGFKENIEDRRMITF